MFRIPYQVVDDPDAPDEFRAVLATRSRWWRAGNGFYLTLRAALREEFVVPVQRALWWPYVTLTEHYGSYDVLYVRNDTRSWHHWTRCFTLAGGERCMRRAYNTFPDIELRVERRARNA